MGRIIEHIDKIARDKQQDVYLIEFDRKKYNKHKYDQYENINIVMKWLKKYNMPLIQCEGYASTHECGSGFSGKFYIDVDFEKNPEKLEKLKLFLGFDAKVLPFDGIELWFLSLSFAMKNADIEIHCD